jgi:hypothetical protein
VSKKNKPDNTHKPHRDLGDLGNLAHTKKGMCFQISAIRVNLVAGESISIVF